MKEKNDAMEPRAVESASDPVPKRQSPRVWPPTHWGEWTYQKREAVSLDDDEPSMEELLSRGGKKVG
jgi:hypothetical protein